MNKSEIVDFPLQISLLRQQPMVCLGGDEIKFKSQHSLELFMYLADSSQDDHSRNELVNTIFEDAIDLESLRKEAIFRLPEQLKGAFVDTHDPSIVQFHHGKAWVDSLEFARSAKALLTQAPLTELTQIEEAKAILGLYQNHFLCDFPSAVDGFLIWQQKRQQELADLRHSLFDQVIQFFLWQAELTEAEQTAEQWLGSLEPGQSPLQYLIWIAAHRQQHARLEALLDMLKKKEQGEGPTSPIGMNAVQWRRSLLDQPAPPLWILRIPIALGNRGLAGVNPHDVLGQDEVLTQIRNAFAQSQSTKIIALTGLAGVGKSTLAQLAGMNISTYSVPYVTIFIRLKTEPDFESILNEILSQLRQGHATSQSLAKKQQLVKQLFQWQRCLIVVDEGNTRKLGDRTIFETIIKMLEGANILFVAQRIADENLATLTVQGLSPKFAKQLLVHKKPELASSGDNVFDDLTGITGGLPLGLNMIGGFLADGRFQPTSFINALKRKVKVPFDQDNTYSNYEAILDWLWQRLLPLEKQIIQAISLFDPLNGASTEDLALVWSELDRDKLDEKIAMLRQLSLITVQIQQDNAERYSLHSIVHRFVRENAAKLDQPALLEQAYIRHFLDYIGQERDDFSDIDTERENIIHMFELVLFGEEHAALFPDAVRALCKVCPYFELRGLYELATKLILKALSTPVLADLPLEHMRILHFAGQVAYKRGDPVISEDYLIRAIALADSIGPSEYYGEIYLDYGLLYLQKGDYAEAMRQFEEAKHWALRYEQLRILCRVAGNSGYCVYQQGFYKDAKHYFDQILEYTKDYEEQNLPLDIMDIVQFSLTWLGLVASEDWDYGEAAVYYRRSMELARQVNNPERIGYLYIDLGVASFFDGDYESAHEYFLQGQLIAEHIQHDDLQTLVLWNQGALASAQHKYEDGERLLKLALTQTLETGLSWLQTQIYIALGKLYFRQGISQKAAICFDSALRNSNQNTKLQAQALYGLSLVELSSSDILGQNNVAIAATQIAAIFSKFNISGELLCTISPQDFEKAHKFFQHDLDGFPQLSRYRIVDGLLIRRSELPCEQKIG